MQGQEKTQQAMSANAPPTREDQLPQVASVERGTGELPGVEEPAGQERRALSSTCLARYLSRIQLERVEKLLALEKLKLHPLPNVRQEIQLLGTIADLLRKAEVVERWLETKGTSPTNLNSGEMILTEKAGSPSSELKEIQELNIVDRHLLRQASRTVLQMKEQGKEVVDASAKLEPDGNREDREAQGKACGKDPTNGAYGPKDIY